MTAQQEENAVKEAGRVLALPCGSACCVSAKVRSFDLGEDAVRPTFGKAGQPGEETELLLQEFAGKISKAPRINKHAAYDECGLAVTSGWIAKLAKFFGFVDATDLQQRHSKKAMTTVWWPWGPPPTQDAFVRIGNCKFLERR